MKSPALTATHARSLLNSTGPISFGDLPLATFTVAGARVLLESIDRIAAGREMQVENREMAREQQFGLYNLDFLVKLHNLSLGIREQGPQGLKARIACARHIFTAMDQGSTVSLDDIRSYRAHTVFCFGDRDFDTLFEMNDGDQVKASLMELAEESASVKDACRKIGWVEVQRERA